MKQKKVSVIGGARSGTAVARLLKSRGARVFLSDKAPRGGAPHVVEELEQSGIAYEFGENTPKVLDADLIVLSPGVPTSIPVVKEAVARGITVVGEVEVASWLCRAPIVAVTGTNGKTTTTTLLGRIFSDAKRPAAVAGNIGTAFSQVVEELDEQSTAILEVSSFQLDTISSFRPRVAVLLNITPDHLDRYEHSFDRYIASKCRIFENQREGDTFVYNADDDIVRANVEKRIHPSVQKLPFSLRWKVDSGAFVDNREMVVRIAETESRIIAVDEISIKGNHNLMNTMAAALAAKTMNIPTASLRATLNNFKGVEHRLEFVRDVNGVSYINDSKATNVDSVWYALQSFSKPTIIMLGGRDKGNDYSPLIALVRKHVKAIVAIGESAEKVVKAFTTIVPVHTAGSMEKAVETASRLATAGDVVLLSPACASFDWFENYEERGRVFKELVMKL